MTAGAEAEGRRVRGGVEAGDAAAEERRGRGGLAPRWTTVLALRTKDLQKPDPDVLRVVLLEVAELVEATEVREGRGPGVEGAVVEGGFEGGFEGGIGAGAADEREARDEAVDIDDSEVSVNVEEFKEDERERISAVERTGG